MSLSAWHHRWNVLALTLLSQALAIGIGTFSFAFWVVPWLDEFHVPRSQIMLAITLASATTGLLSPFVGIALDRYPPRRLYFAGTLLLAGGLALISLAGSHWEILAAYALILPLGTTLIGQLGAQTLVTRWFAENRGFAIGISATGVSLGALVMPPLVTVLLSAGGWRFAFQMLAVTVLATMLPATWLALSRQPEMLVPGHQSRSDGAQPQWTTALLLRNRDFWLISSGVAGLLFGVAPIMYGIGAYARDLGITQAQAAWAASFSAVTMAVAKLGFGKLVDRLEHHVCYWIAGAFVISGVVIVSNASGFVALAIGTGLTMMGQGAVLPFLSSTIATRFGIRAFGQVAGLATFVMSFGSLAPFAAGAIRDACGSYGMAFIAMLVPLMAIMIAMRWLSRPGASKKRTSVGPTIGEDKLGHARPL